MVEYDARRGFSDRDWQDISDEELCAAVTRHHGRTGAPSGLSPSVHASFHVIAERQLAARELPEARQAFERLIADGLSRHDAVHALAQVTAELTFDATRGELNGDVNALLRAKLRRIARDGATSDFEFRAPLFGESDDEDEDSPEAREDGWDDEGLNAWLDTLESRFRAWAREHDVAVAGWAGRFLGGLIEWGLHPAEIDDAKEAVDRVMEAPMGMPCEPADAEAIIAELRAFFRFAASAFDWPVGDEAADALGGDLVVPQLRNAIATTPKLADTEALLRAHGVDVTNADELMGILEEPGALEAVFERPSAPVTPIRREGPKIGRNDPCPCGSGRKYKKCCGR